MLGRDDLHRRRTVRHYNVPRVNPGLGALLALHICPGRARPVRLRCIAVARAKVRAWMWRLFGGPPAARAAGPGHRRRNGALDVDSTLVIAHSDKDGAALTTSVRMTSIRSRSPATTPVNCSLSGCGRVTSGRTPPPITSTSLAEAIAQIHDRPSWSASMSAITSPPSAIMMARSTSRPRSLHRPPATPRQPGRQGLRQPGPAGPAPRPATRTDRGPAQRTSRGDRGHPRLHDRLRGISGAARTRLHPRDCPAAVSAPARRPQGGGRGNPGCTRPVARARPARSGRRVRPAAGFRGDSRRPVQLLAGDHPGCGFSPGQRLHGANHQDALTCSMWSPRRYTASSGTRSRCAFLCADLVTCFRPIV
jgi:hypothetical protein